jgi:transposase InsO family protein
MKGEHPVGMLCELFGVSRSGYYRWQAAKPTKRQCEDAALAAQIARFHRESRGNYGAPRLVADLREAGSPTGRRRCARLMRALGVQGKKKHRRKPRTTDSRHGRTVAPNLVKLAQTPCAPDQLWVTDITYLQTGEGWLYLAAILDAWSRRVIGWACAPTLAAPLVIAALRIAVQCRRPSAGTIHHSDRGSQYTDAQLLELIDATGLARSMSRAGNCYDNAMIESFWSTLKTETDMDVVIPATRRDAELAVFDYIETFYNPKRRHSSLGQISPAAFELKHQKSNIKAA